MTNEAIAAESDNVPRDRSETLVKLKSLERGLSTLNYFRRLRMDGRYFTWYRFSLLASI